MDKQIEQKVRAVLGAGPPSHADITYILSLRGYTQTDVARACGCSTSSVRDVLTDRNRSWDIATKIGELTGVPLERLWPGAYSHTPRGARRALPAPERRTAA